MIPLKKEDDSVHPIAVSELIYRLCAKALIAAHFRPDFLLPFQLGMKSPGGVEPIVKLTERVLEGTVGREFPFLAFLDASNAFSRVPPTRVPFPEVLHPAELNDTCRICALATWWTCGLSSTLSCGRK